MKNSITAHCLIKNEENFIWYAVKSVIDFVDKLIIFDTGSQDNTVKIVNSLKKEYPTKIFFEQKGLCDKEKHTEFRNEMIKRTDTDWFMILDGDEVWTSRGMIEALDIINSNKYVKCIISPFYLCVGDVFHHSLRGKFGINGQKMHMTPRLFECDGLRWTGKYGRDYIIDKDGEKMFKKNNIILKNRFWHLTHLERSSIENDFSSGGKRKDKKRLTYFLIGKKIKEQVPEVFKKNGEKYRLNFIKSFLNFWKILFR